MGWVCRKVLHVLHAVSLFFFFHTTPSSPNRVGVSMGPTFHAAGECLVWCGLVAHLLGYNHSAKLAVVLPLWCSLFTSDGSSQTFNLRGNP